MKFTRRSYLRTYRDAPVDIQFHGLEGRFCGTMRNCCRDGMQLTTEQFIAPGSPIVILARDRSEMVLKGIVGEGRPAKVLWCRSLAEGVARRFSVGVQFMAAPDDQPPVCQPPPEREA